MGLMVVLCLIWGLQQVVLKAAAADVAPLLMIALRSGVAALLVGLLMAWRGERAFPGDGAWRPGLLAGVLFAGEFVFLGEGLRHTTASHMAVFLYTAPVFAALGLHWRLPAERLRPLQWAGIALAFAGIVLTFSGRGVVAGPAPTAAAPDILWGDFLGLLAGVCWGATTVVVRCSSLARAPATRTLLYQLVVGFVILLLAAVVSGQAAFKPTPLAWASLAFHGLVVSFASYLAWFWLLRHYLASRLGVFSFLTPLFGVGLGVWLLGEPLDAGFVSGAACVLAGIVLVSGNGWLEHGLRKLGAARSRG